MTRRSASSRRAGASENKPSDPAKQQSKRAGSKKGGGAWAEPTPAQIEQDIRDSRLPLVVSLEIPGTVSTEREALPRLDLIETGANSWPELVALQRAIDGLKHPTRTTRGGDIEEDTLEGMVFLSGGRPELQLSTGAVNSVHKFANTLLLRVQSLGLPVRSLLKDRILIRLPEGSAPTNTRKTVSRDTIIISASGSSEPTDYIYRLQVPRLDIPKQPISQLRHLELESMVDALLENHATTGRVQVVILRGIPGSGKSTLGKEIVAICQTRGVSPVVCSADTHFETPRGYQFDVKSISKAHEASQAAFRAAVKDQRVSMVVVDNTHTQKWEYQVYEDTAAEQKCRVHLLEMHCPDLLTCTRMAQRNSHGVSVVKVMAMYLRWEADNRAVVFQPSFQDPLVLENPITRNPVNNYVAYVGLFLYEETRQRVLERVPRRHGNVIAEHITLFFRPTTQYIRQAPIGKKYRVRVTHVVEDDRGQALQVDLSDQLPLKCMNKVPHITLSTAQGVSAFYSNELLDDPKAKRCEIEGLEVEVTLGVALMAQNRKIVSLTSPFDDQFTLKTVESEIPEPETPVPYDTLVVLDVDESDLATSANESVEQALVRYAMVKHSCGPYSTSRRIVVVRQSGHSIDETSHVVAVKKFLSPPWAAEPLTFDSVDTIASGLTLATKLETIDGIGSLKQVTVLTTRVMSSVAQELAGFAGSYVVKQLPTTENHIARLAPDLDASLTRTLDAMLVSPTEQSCHVVKMAVQIAEQALAEIGFPRATVSRVDSALWTHPASIIDISTTASVTEASAEDLVTALRRQGVQNTRVTNANIEPVVLFQLPTKSTVTPTIRWLLDPSSAHECVEAVDRIRCGVRDSLSPASQEVYPRIVGVVSAVLRSGVERGLELRTLQLASERAVLAYLQSHDSTGSDDLRKPSDHQALWAHVVACLSWLAAWPCERWTAEQQSLTVDCAAHIQRLIQCAAEAARGSDASEISGSVRWSGLLLSLLRRTQV